MSIIEILAKDVCPEVLKRKYFIFYMNDRKLTGMKYPST